MTYDIWYYVFAFLDVLMSVINWQHEPDGAPRDITCK